MLADSVSLSVASYGAEFYGVDKGQVNKVQVKINDTMRKITKSGNRRSIKDMLQELKWLTFPEIINYNKIVLMDKIASQSCTAQKQVVNNK